MMRKILCFALVFAMLVSGGVVGATYGVPDEFEIKKSVLINYNGRGGIVEIPDGVTSIERGAFLYCENLTGVTFPDSLINIGENAFTGCKNLTSITIPGSIESIGEYAFENCHRLENVTMQKGVARIGRYAFNGCEGLTGITIPGSVVSIGEGAFLGCRNLTDVVIEAGVQEIGNGIFEYCSALENVTIPSTVTTIRGNLFGYPDYSYYSRPVVHVAAGSVAETYVRSLLVYDCVTDQPYVQPMAAGETIIAYQSTQKVSVYGEQAEFQMYGLKDTNGYMTNYIRLRDLAYVLEDEFNVTWDGVVKIERYEEYVPDGSEMNTPFCGDRTCVHQNTDILVYFAGITQIESLDSITLTDDVGGGYTYFKLRDLGEVLGFDVTWDVNHGISIDNLRF